MRNEIAVRVAIVVTVDPAGATPGWWARVRLALSILAGRPVLVDVDYLMRGSRGAEKRRVWP